jgi:hypothetical protein
VASRYQQVTDPEEAWKYYEAGLLLRRFSMFSYTPKEPPSTAAYYKEHEVAGKVGKQWLASTLAGFPEIYFILVEDD